MPAGVFDPQAGNTPGTHRDTQGGPEDVRGTALPLAATSFAPTVSSSAVVNATDVTVASVSVVTDPTYDGRYMLLVGGTSGADAITLQKGSAANWVTVVINGVTRGQFTAPAGAAFSQLVLYGNDGNDSITVNANLGAIPAMLYGQAGNDTLVGGAGASLIDGGIGNDLITGGTANDILIGGSGADNVTTAKTDNILIGGTYVFSEDLDAAAALLSAWSSSASFTTRVQLLRTGVGPESLYQLNASTVFDDAASDVLSGAAAGTDWYFAATLDTTKKKPTDVLN